MNLPYTYALLLVASKQKGFLKVTGLEAAREVEQMAATGLVQANFDDGKAGSFTAIIRVLPAGDTFLRTFKDKLPRGLPSIDEGESLQLALERSGR